MFHLSPTAFSFPDFHKDIRGQVVDHMTVNRERFYAG